MDGTRTVTFRKEYDYSDFVNECAKAMSGRLTSEMLDALGPTLRRHGWHKERTCHDIKTEEGISFHCSECDCVVLLDEVGESGIMADGVISPKYCPNCGAKVVD